MHLTSEFRMFVQDLPCFVFDNDTLDIDTTVSRRKYV